ncbi:hypothetical protein CD798_08590 [Bacillaceae bacterium SAOS 7]|nr:hypothetical protein CD798_08590 [Bacillaceae bacterium SAOS 7]
MSDHQLQISDTFAQLKTHIQNTKNKGATNLTNKGTNASSTDSLDSLMSKIASVETGWKSASGSISSSSSTSQSVVKYNRKGGYVYPENGNMYVITVNILNIKPKFVVIYARGDSDQVTVCDITGLLGFVGKVTWRKDDRERHYYMNENPALYVDQNGFKLAYDLADDFWKIFWVAFG